MDTVALVKPEEREDGERGFVVDGTVLYEAAVADLTAAVESKTPPPRYVQVGNAIIQNPLLLPYYQAAPLGAETLKLALVPFDETAEWEPQKRALRAQALELARLWFTERLHQAVGYGPMALHILKGDGRWKL